MSHCCPTCGQSMPTDPLELQVDAIRAWCSTSGVAILLGDCIRRSDAATYLGRSNKTLCNWDAIDCPIPVRRLNRRAYYEIRDLAAFVVKEASR